MSLLDEFCFLIGNNSVLLKAYTEPNHRKIISSKGYLNSSKVRETSIKLIGDNMLGSITRHGGIPSHVFTDEVFFGKTHAVKFLTTNLIRKNSLQDMEKLKHTPTEMQSLAYMINHHLPIALEPVLPVGSF